MNHDKPKRNLPFRRKPGIWCLFLFVRHFTRCSAQIQTVWLSPETKTYKRAVSRILNQPQAHHYASSGTSVNAGPPTTRNYMLELPTFGVIARINPIEVQ